MSHYILTDPTEVTISIFTVVTTTTITTSTTSTAAATTTTLLLLLHIYLNIFESENKR